MVLVCVACGDNETLFTEPTEVEADAGLCHWRRPEGCKPCVDQRDYGADNTCTEVTWRGRSETDFCLQTYPCIHPPQPVTRIEE